MKQVKMEESKYMDIDGLRIHYTVSGRGRHALLLLHSAVGSTNDFALQMGAEHGLSVDEFTMVAFDMPGYGKSESFGEALKTEPTLLYYKKTSEIAAQLMAALGHKTYAVGGWSDGARVACLLAIRHQARVDALILWAFVPVHDKHSSYAIGRTRDVGTWDKEALAFYTATYGEESFTEQWHAYVDYLVLLYEYSEHTFDIRARLNQIKCPTLILHGGRDPIVSYKEHVVPVESRIHDSDVMQFKDMAQNIHQADAKSFNGVVSTFVTSLLA